MTNHAQPQAAGNLNALRHNRGLLWFAAIAGIVAGTLAILMPFLATLAANLTFAALLLVLGLTQIIAAFRAGGMGRIAGMMLMGILSIVTGGVLLVFPAAGIIALTTLLTAYLIASGALKTYFSFKIRPQRGWGWMLAGGLATFALGGILFSGLPGASFWVLGLFVGIDMLMYSFGLLGLLIATRDRFPPKSEADDGIVGDQAMSLKDENQSPKATA